MASPIVERFGTRAILLAGLPAIVLGMALLALMPSGLGVFVLLVVYGAIYGIANVAMNIEADRVEAASGRRLMNGCHGVWSIGQLLATLLGTLASGAAISPLLHFSALVLPVTLAVLVALGPFAPAPPRAHAGTAGKGPRLAWPTARILLLVAFITGPAILEGALRNWSVIFLRDSFSAASWVNTLSLPVFLLAQSLGRLRADAWVTRFGPVAVARALTGLALLGLVLAVVAPSLPVALLGCLLIGVGVCVTYPLTTSAAAALGDRPASLNVAALTLATQVAVLGAPAALGLVAETFGIRAAFAVSAPLVVLALFLAPALAPRPASAKRGSA